VDSQAVGEEEGLYLPVINCPSRGRGHMHTHADSWKEGKRLF